MPDPEAPEPRPYVYWPLGLSVVVLVAGAVVVLFETYNVLGLVGLLMIGAAVYGISRRDRRGARRAGTTAADRPALAPPSEMAPSRATNE